MLDQRSSERRILRPLVLARPVRLVWPPSWAAHIPFAFWLIDAIKPRALVELGTQTGVSYSAFVQAVLTLQLETTCYAVDTWAGDPQTGFYGESVYDEWFAFHERHFAGQSRLVRSTFDEAVSKFSDESIDLLHIDGLHTYDAVRHDFATWVPKLSSRAVVLFHDTNVRESDFGVWKFWEELRTEYPSFSFVHGHGLGVLVVGDKMPEAMAWLTGLEPDEAPTVRRVFSTLGDLWSTHIALERARDESTAAANERARVTTALRDAETRLSGAVSEIERLKSELTLRDQLARNAESAIANSAALAAKMERADTAIRQLLDDVHSGVLEEVSAQEVETAALVAASAGAERLRHEASLDHLDSVERLRGVLIGSFRRSLSSTTLDVPTTGVARLRQHAISVGLDKRTLISHPVGAVRSLAPLLNARFRNNLTLLDRSRLFDAAYYAAHAEIRDVPRTRLREHFIRHGDRLGISPHALFDARWYRERNVDLPADTRLLMHYLRFGSQERRDPHPLFDSHHYAAQASEDLAPSLLTHYLYVSPELSPHPLFDTAHYLSQHPALVAAGHNPLLNYLMNARLQTFDPHPLFSTSYYVAINPDIAAPVNPLVHFVRHGAREGRCPHPLFDIAHYWRQRPDVKNTGVNALIHYLIFGAAEGIDPHPLFESSYYESQLPTGARGRVNPLVDFVEGGWRRGFKPNAWFDPLWYLERNPDLDSQINPLWHYIEDGWREGRDPSPLFSTNRYLSEHPDVAAADENPLAHFLRLGRPAGAAPPLAAAAASRRLLQVSGIAETLRTIVVVSHVVPWPVRAGNEYRLQRLLRHLKGQGYRVVLVLAPLDADPPAPGALERIAEDFGNVVLCRPDGHVQYRLRDCPDVIGNLAGTPTEVTPVDDAGTPFVNADLGLCHDVVFTISTGLLHTLGRVALIVEYIFMTRVMASAGEHVLKMVDTHDVFSQKGTNVIAFGIKDAHIRPQDEAKRLCRADVIIGIHREDAAALSALAPDREVLVAGVDADVIDERPWPNAHTVFLAGSANPLNLAGLRDFVRFAWPRVRARVPDATLRVAGGIGTAVPPGSAGITTLGHVPDLAEEYAAARVVINPTVAGTGLKIKTVEAVAHLVPVVCWPHGRDGLSEDLDRFVYESSDWRDFADAVIRMLLSDNSPFNQTAIDHVRRELSAQAVYEMLDRRLERFFAHSSLEPGDLL